MCARARAALAPTRRPALISRLRRARARGGWRHARAGLNNGLSNALKFTPDGGVIGVGCAVERAAPQPDGADAWAVRISVRDSGAGMSAQELQLLLHGDSFTQVGQGQLQGSAGTGLGLTIVKHILQLHGPGCSLQIASAGHGHGTTFTLHLLLPAHTAAADGQARRAADADAGAARGTPTPSAPLRFPPDFRVLYVEVRRAAALTRTP